MSETDKSKILKSKVLLHLYNYAVTRSLASIQFMARTQLAGSNPRKAELQALHSAIGVDNERVFLSGAVAIAEFVAYKIVDFIEMYNLFDSEENSESSPRLELAYIESNTSPRLTISEFESEELGTLFREITRDPQVRSLVESAISQLVSNQNDTSDRV